MINIDSFNCKKHNSFSIKINEETKKIWDIPEDSNCKLVYNHSGDKQFYIRRFFDKTDNLVVHYLDTIHNFIYLIKKKLLHYNVMQDKLEHAKIILIITPHTVGEMPINEKFEGLNKPKNIVKLSRPDGLQFKQDSDLRASNRHILLTLRDLNGNLKKEKDIKKLIIHELAHTMCNHVTFRDKGNHLDDFKRNEKFLTSIINSDNILCDFLETNFNIRY